MLIVGHSKNDILLSSLKNIKLVCYNLNVHNSQISIFISKAYQYLNIQINK